jgi:hypothetical protein
MTCGNLGTRSACSLQRWRRKCTSRSLRASWTIINASVDALQRLFSAVMDISKLDAGAVEPVRCSFPLHR